MDRLDGDELLLADQRGMRWPFGDRPILGGAAALDVAVTWDPAVGRDGVAPGVLPIRDATRCVYSGLGMMATPRSEPSVVSTALAVPPALAHVEL